MGCGALISLLYLTVQVVFSSGGFLCIIFFHSHGECLMHTTVVGGGGCAVFQTWSNIGSLWSCI